MTPADLAAVVADWCDAHGVGRVDLASALLGADLKKTSARSFISGGCSAVRGKMYAAVDAKDLFPTLKRKEKSQRRAAALAVAAMRCDLEGR